MEHKNTVKLHVQVYHNSLNIRFINMKQQGEFHRFKNHFKKEFPNAIWNWSYDTWSIPKSETGRFDWVVHRFFGYDAIKYVNNLIST